MKVIKNRRKPKKKKQANDNVASRLREYDRLRERLKPLYAFDDYGNYPAIVRLVKDLKVYLCESEIMNDID